MAELERDARIQARDDARSQAQELARVNAQLEAAQLEVVRLQRAAEVPAPQLPQDGQGAASRQPQPFAFPQKVTYPELTKLYLQLQVLVLRCTILLLVTLVTGTRY